MGNDLSDILSAVRLLSTEKATPLGGGLLFDITLRLGDIATELGQLTREMYMLIGHEKTAKLTAWVSSDDRSTTGREKWADYQALNTSVEILNIKGEIAALEAERDFLCLLHRTLNI